MSGRETERYSLARCRPSCKSAYVLGTYTATSASASTRTIDSSSRSPPTAAAAEPFSLSELPALMSYAEEVLDNFDLKKQAFAAGEIDDDELIDEFERQILSMTRRLRRAKKSS
ncbi:hypothetical protein MRX96_050941 [Rhipicephalus microplus]